jgi:ankyrin repeat protein
MTALMAAALPGHATVVKLLLDAKADPNHSNNVSSSLFKSLPVCDHHRLRAL